MSEPPPSVESPPSTLPQTRDEFLDVLRRSEIVEPAALERWLNGPGADLDSAERTANGLVAARLITNWQCKKLWDGRWKGFFLGKYKILDHLGAGAMGRVYLAEHRVMRRQVALKVLAKRLSGRDAYIQRFQQEARAAGAVNNPRIVKAFDIDCEEDLHFIVMEFVDGVDLQKVVLRDGPLPIRTAAETTRQIAEGLAAVHRAGLIHRDIKPANVLLDRQGDVHVLDLGLARLADSDEPSLTLVHDTKLIGTVDYLAPEQARNSHEIDSRADLYSLGGTLYFLLSGQPPFNEGTLPQRVAMHLTTPPVDIRQRRTETPAELARICHKLLEKDPPRRYQLAEDVVADLQAFLKFNAPDVGPSASRPRLAPALSDAELSFAEQEFPPEGQGKSPSSRIRSSNSKVSGRSQPSASRASSATGASSGSAAQSRPQPAPNKPVKRGAGSDVLSPSQLSGGKLSDTDLAAATPDQLHDPGNDTAFIGGSDSLAGLLEELMPEALVPQTVVPPLTTPQAHSTAAQHPASQSGIIGRNTQPAAAPAPSSPAVARPVPEPVPANAYEALLRSVTKGEGDMGGFMYQTWFLVLIGLLLGSIVGYMVLFVLMPAAAPPKKGNQEQPRLNLPLAPPSAPQPASNPPLYSPAPSPPPAPPSGAGPTGTFPPAASPAPSGPIRGRRGD